MMIIPTTLTILTPQYICQKRALRGLGLTRERCCCWGSQRVLRLWGSFKRGDAFERRGGFQFFFGAGVQLREGYQVGGGFQGGAGEGGGSRRRIPW